MNILRSMVLPFCALASALLVGCGNDTTIDRSYEKAGLESADLQRKLFDSVKGDWNKLSEADKASFTKSAGGDAVMAQASWIGMRDGGPAAQQYLRENGRAH